MPITAKELAKKLKLSQTAVSMALNNKPGVKNRGIGHDGIMGTVADCIDASDFIFL